MTATGPDIKLIVTSRSAETIPPTWPLNHHRRWDIGLCLGTPAKTSLSVDLAVVETLCHALSPNTEEPKILYVICYITPYAVSPSQEKVDLGSRRRLVTTCRRREGSIENLKRKKSNLLKHSAFVHYFSFWYHSLFFNISCYYKFMISINSYYHLRIDFGDFLCYTVIFKLIRYYENMHSYFHNYI